MNELDKIFINIKNVLQSYSQNLDVREKFIDSQVKDEKPGLHLYGTKIVNPFNTKPKPMYFGGVIKQKNYVSFYFSPIYSHREEFYGNLSPSLKKFLKGKSCFNITKEYDNLYAEISSLIVKGVEKYQKLELI